MQQQQKKESFIL